MSSDQLLMETFSVKQIESLQSIVAYVDDMVLSKTKTENIEEAYHEYFDSLSKQLENGITKDGFKLNAPFKEQEKYQFLKNIDKDVFNGIWVLVAESKVLSASKIASLDQMKDLELSTSGLYMDYLNKLGVTDNRYKDLYDLIQSTGGMVGPSTFMSVHERFDFGVVKNRLWAAIYLLNLKDIDIEMKGYQEEN
ncbi:hypothetical protein BZG01_08350 [Labilibaculum manganireducens]|uniref:Uncharacterized protein n=2 Tax=Labilibaculum manganireducens TaxID=1940525 RepID=A0A2N3I9T1_9BACT|nr:hypothetical protein BZG01_08350 [Labilibaculum manganireducens]